MKLYYTNRTIPTCFGLSCGGLQGGAFRRTDTSKYYGSFEPMHRYKTSNFKNNTLLKHIKDPNTNKTFNFYIVYLSICLKISVTFDIFILFNATP
jgi:hypothetical protein